MKTSDLFFQHAGDCHLTEWSEWSSCELTCINGRSFETTGRQSRSRAFIVQSPENQESCSGQAMETRPCSGSVATALLTPIFKSLFWVCCKVKTKWYWYCRREMLRLPVENQPLARQRTHSVVSALRWNQCHRYLQKLPCTPMNEKPPSRFFFCISCSGGSWAPLLTPPEFHFRFACRKGRWELTSLAVRSTSHMSLHESIWVSYLYCWVGHGKRQVYMY